MLRKPLARDVPAPFLPAVHSPQTPIWRPRPDKHCLVQPRTEVLGQTRLTVQLQCWHSRWSDSRCPWQAALCKDQVNRKVGQVAVANSPPEGQQAEQTSDDSKLWLMEAAIAGRLFRSISYWQHSSTEHVVGTDMCAVIYMSCIHTYTVHRCHFTAHCFCHVPSMHYDNQVSSFCRYICNKVSDFSPYLL